jgi:hypothetical protein
MKCRLLYLHPETNPGKIECLERLHREYVAYVHICVQHMLDKRRYTLKKSEKQAFFPPSDKLTSQIVKNARDHAIQIVSTWAKGVYARKLQPTITNLRRENSLTKDEAKALYIVGKRLIGSPWKFITQQDIDAYNALLDRYGGNKPQVRPSLPMRLSEMTGRLEDPNEALLPAFWLRVSSLEYRKSIWLPLSGNPYVKKASDVSKGISARKTKTGRWRFEVVDKKVWTIPEIPEDAPRIAVDVGLNVLATDSDGRLYGASFKPKFDKLYKRLQSVRANRQRQGLRENSPRLDRLESRLTGMIKTETGRIVNELIRKHPENLFVVEDLDLRGSRGQKRFAYRALQTNLERKACIEKVNPAYTSQECSSCGYIHRGNRHGIKFVCRSCGRRAHADWVGASGILRRSEDKDITCKDRPRDVKRILRERYLQKRNSSSGVGRSSLPPDAPLPLSQRFTTGVPDQSGIGTASKSSPLDFSRFQ